MGVDGILNLARGLANGVRNLVRRLLARGEPPPAI
jgi:hypothetical protein